MPADPATIRILLAQAVEVLATDSPRLDAELLLACCLDKNRSYLYAWPDVIPPADIQARFRDLVARRVAGEPVAYLLGQREFWSLPLTVTPATLIPRPETETLVALALARIPAGADALIADLGTGSGAIALAIARERPRCRIIATDISQDALAVAAANAQRLGLSNVQCLAGDWCSALPDQQFDLIVSNPPYIAEDDSHLTRGTCASSRVMHLPLDPRAWMPCNTSPAVPAHGCARKDGCCWSMAMTRCTLSPGCCMNLVTGR